MTTKLSLPGLVKGIKTAKRNFNLTAIFKSSVAVFALLLVVLAFTSCEENMWLRSEKKLRSQLNGTWNRLFVTSNIQKNETWTFKDGTITIVETELTDNNKDNGYDDLNDADGLDTTSVDRGNYSVDAKIDNAYIRIDNLEKNVVEAAKQGLNSKWTIVDISGSILYIAADNGTAIIQREFEKK